MKNAKPSGDEEESTSAGAYVFLLVLIGFCILICSGAFLWGLTETIQGKRRSADYHRAPGCTPTGVASSGVSPCWNKVMKVAAKDKIDDDDTPPSYSLSLWSPWNPDEDEQKVHLESQFKAELFNAVAVGGLVRVKMWRGEALMVSGAGYRCGTEHHPDVQAHNGGMLLVVGSLSTALLACTMPSTWRSYKKAKADAVANTLS